MKPSQEFEKCLNTAGTAIYVPHEDDPNGTLFIDLQKTISDLLKRKSDMFGITNAHFYLLCTPNINGCAKIIQDEFFVAITRGTIDFAINIVAEVCKDQNFLFNLLGPSSDISAKFAYDDFSSSRKFITNNYIGLKGREFNSNNYLRRSVADAMITYFVLFFLLHEIGHLRQQSREAGEANLNLRSQKGQQELEENIIKQVREIDADLYATNHLASELISTFLLKRGGSENILFYNRRTVCYFSFFIPLLLFYLLNDNKASLGNLKASNYPPPAARAAGTINCLIQIIIENQFLEKEELNNLGKFTINSFGKAFANIFPNSKIESYYHMLRDVEIKKHLSFLCQAAKNVPGLNGFGLGS